MPIDDINAELQVIGQQTNEECSAWYKEELDEIEFIMAYHNHMMMLQYGRDEY